MGKIEEINIKGLNVDMIIVYKYNLILIAIMDKAFKKHNIRDEAERALDMFYTTYYKEVNECKEAVNICEFEDFKKILATQIKKYFENTKEKEKEIEIGDFGFFTEAIRKLKSQK
ncbi:MAG: hypothetical protein ACTSQJ_18515 [Promethearchaeota archaeon]